MKKQDLKDGMVLETAHTARYLVINSRILDFDGFIMLDDYSEDLKNKHDKDYDIVKVYKVSESYSLLHILGDENLTLIWERKETKLTDREIQVLKALKTLGYTYISRDTDNELAVYSHKPEKQGHVWNGYHITYLMQNDFFNFIKREDKEPTTIDDLLRGV